jgi:hypothetical protein
MSGAICHYCGTRTSEELFGTPRCSSCSGRAIDRPDQAPEPCLRVRAALATRGIHVTRGVFFELRSLSAIQRTIPTLPDLVHGLTRIRRLHDGTLHEKIIVTVRAGLPLEYFEACVAHELVHVAIAEAGSANLPALIEEGFAEYVAWLYLTQDSGGPHAHAVAERISRRRGDEYGEGYEVVARAAAREGFERTWRSIGSRRFRVAMELKSRPGARA